MEYGYIYMTENVITGDRYIGQHKLDQRNRTKEYLGSGTRLTHAIKKYGRANFRKTIIEYCADAGQLNERERYWISFYDAQRNPMFYNIAEGGMAGNIWDGLTYEEQERVKEKIRANNFKRDYSAFKERFAGEGNPAYGRHWYKDDKTHTQYFIAEEDERIVRLGLVRGMYRTEEHNKKISISNKGKPHKSPSSGKVCIHKDGKNKYVHGEEVKDYIVRGWEIGGKSFVGTSKGWKKMTNGIVDVYAKTQEDEKILLAKGYWYGVRFVKRKRRRTKNQIERERMEKYHLVKEDL